MISLPIRVFATRLFQLPLPKAALLLVEHPKSSAVKPVRCEPLFLNLTNWQGNVIDLIGEAQQHRSDHG
jgi:hypothetical protein